MPSRTIGGETTDNDTRNSKITAYVKIDHNEDGHLEDDVTTSDNEAGKLKVTIGKGKRKKLRKVPKEQQFMKNHKEVERLYYTTQQYQALSDNEATEDGSPRNRLLVRLLSVKDEMLKVTTIIGAYVLALPLMCNLLPVLPEFEDYGWGDFEDEPENFTNSSDSKDLYVIRTIVYEIGILTDAGNDTNSTETHEEVNLKFYDPEHNGSRIVLDDIPIPIQTNVSGTSITGIAPFDFGDLELEEGEPPKLNGTVLPNAVVTVSRNVTTTTGQAGAALLRKLGPFLEQQ